MQVPYDAPDYVFLGPKLSIITISYPARLASPSAPATRTEFTVDLLNQVRPSITSSVVQSPEGNLTYNYQLRNEPEAGQPIAAWSLAVPADDAVLDATHQLWHATHELVPGIGTPLKGAVSMAQIGLNTWHSAGQPVAPGATAGGFVLTSRYLPGFTTAYARSAEDYALPAELPSSVSAQLAPMRQREWMNKTTIAIGPRFPRDLPKEFIAADFRQTVDRLLAARVLTASSPFVGMLTSTLDQFRAQIGQPASLDNLSSVAVTPVEQNIANALQISLR